MNVGQAERTMAAQTGQMDVTQAVPRVVKMAHAVLLRTRSVVGLVQQMGICQNGQRPEKRRPVNGRQLAFQVGQAERVAEAMPDVPPN